MERPIAYDKLAREDRFVRMRARRINELRVEQGLSPFPDLSSQESIDERFNLGGARGVGEADGVPIAISTEIRRLAGFTDEEIQRLVRATQRSPVY